MNDVLTLPKGHVVCFIHPDHLTIERDNQTIGVVREVEGKPLIQMLTDCPQLTFEDIDIIMDNWNVMQELGGVIENVVDKLPKTGKLTA